MSDETRSGPTSMEPAPATKVDVGSAGSVRVESNGDKRRDWQLFSITALIVTVLGGVLILVCWKPPVPEVWPFADKVFQVLSYALTTALGGLLGQAIPRK